MDNIIDIEGEITITLKDNSILFESDIDKSINYDNNNKTLILQSKNEKIEEVIQKQLVISRGDPLVISRELSNKPLLVITFTPINEDICVKYFDEEIESICDDLFKIINDDNDKDIYVYIVDVLRIIFPVAIELGNDYLVESILDKCIEYHNEKFKPKILNVITTSFSKLHTMYPNYFNKFVSTLTICSESKNGNHKLNNSTKHLQSYTKDIENGSDGSENAFSKFRRYKFLYFYLLSPYMFNIIMYMAIIYINTSGSIISLIVIGCITVTILLMYDTQNPILAQKLSKILRINLTKISTSNKGISAELLIPFTKIATYPADNSSSLKELFRPSVNDFIRNRYDNPYTGEISDDLYSNWNGEALINFKWDHFGKFYYYCNWHIFNLYFFFSALIIYPNYPKNLAISILSIVFGIFLVLFEIRKFIFNPIKYLFKGSNYLNLAVYILPIWNSINFSLQETTSRVWVLAISILLLHTKIILFLRTERFFERYIVIILCVARFVFSFLMIMLFVILAYADSFWLLLRNSPDSQKFYANYNSSVAALTDIMSGETSSLESLEISKDLAIAIIWASFTFLLIVYLLNLFIGLLTNSIEIKDKRKYILAQKAEIIAEIELYWLLPNQRRWKVWFPDYIWYNVPLDKLREKIQSIDEDNSYQGYKPIIHPKLRELINPKKELKKGKN